MPAYITSDDARAYRDKAAKDMRDHQQLYRIAEENHRYWSKLLDEKLKLEGAER